jgi:hypothetical protein
MPILILPLFTVEETLIEEKNNSVTIGTQKTTSKAVFTIHANFVHIVFGIGVY